MRSLAIAGALLAGLSFAVGSVLQQREAQLVEAGDTRRLIKALMRRRRWLGGLAVASSAYGWQALALANGPLTLVQPLLVFELPFALVLAARVHRRRIGLREMGAALMVAGGIGIFLLSASPRGGADQASTTGWLTLLPTMAFIVGALTIAAGRAQGSVPRTSLLAGAAAVTFATMAPLMKATTELFESRGVATVITWQPWVMSVVALVGFTLSQRAFHSGSIAVSLPVLQAVQPIVGVAVGVTVFNEPIVTSPQALLGELLAAALAVTGIALLDTSPGVAAQEGEPRALPAPVPAQPRVIDLDESRVVVLATPQGSVSDASASSTGKAVSRAARSGASSAATRRAR
jgi:drug/metabolite transporter (DMT)-like permease